MNLCTVSKYPIKRLKHVVSLRRTRSDSHEEYRPYFGLKDIEPWTGRLLSDSVESKKSTPDLDSRSINSYFETGDVLFGKLGPHLAKVWIAEVSGRSTTEFLAMRPVMIEHRFLKYICLRRDFIDVLSGSTYGSTMPRIEWNFIGNINIPVPERRIQCIISDYLDSETEQIDALVAAKERLLELLAEKRSAFIARAITHGLNPNVSFRDSGIPWLHKIPSHWTVERSRWLLRERDQRSEMGEEELLTVSHLTGVTPRYAKRVSMFEADSKEGYKVCHKSDLVINTLWAWMGAMGIAPMGGIVSPAYHVYELSGQLEPGYIDALVRTSAFAQEVMRHSKGVWSSRLRLYPEGLFEIQLPVPPIEEQRQIVSYISNENRKLDALNGATERTIDLLRERRTALITAAVTGQIDVKEMAA